VKEMSDWVRRPCEVVTGRAFRADRGQARGEQATEREDLMATLGQVGDVMTGQLGERVARLVSAVENESPDFTEIASLADAVAEFADRVGDLYRDVDRQLLAGLNRDRADEHEGPSRNRPSQPAQSASAADEVTKEELLEQARELHVEGRSSMTKEELARAVEAEESVTKEELLERARDANIEGRSSMTKDELRQAVHEAGS
jgi:hypothetical protein